MKKFNLTTKQIGAAVLLFLFGGTAIGVSGYDNKEQTAETMMIAAQAEIAATTPQPLVAETHVAETTEAESPAETVAETVAETTAEAEEGFIPNVVQLNLAYQYPEGADETESLNSLAGSIFQTLMEKDENWMSNLYDQSDITPEQMAKRLGKARNSVMGLYNANDDRHNPNDPNSWTINTFEKVHIKLSDGDGNASNGFSNVVPIMSMASVYTWFDDPEDPDAFLEYALNLWNKSHSYSVSMGKVYYCKGCLGDDSETHEMEELLVEDALERAASTMAGVLDEVGLPSAEGDLQELASGSNAEAAAASAEERQKVNCPGHVDLNINARIISFEGKRNLFTIDPIGNHSNNIQEDGWEGWNTYTKSYATRLSQQDWFERYGLSVSSLSVRNPLTDSEIEVYMNDLPADLSEEKREMIRFALASVGRVPYHWGGKAVAAGYDGNQFGTITGPDEKGRILRGLDCSGWINWVYWSATGSRLPYENTSGLALAGKRVNRSELEPGDIILRTGTNAHVIMFLGWEEDGRVRCIHETSGGINNVTVAVRDANWPYLRRIIE